MLNSVRTDLRLLLDCLKYQMKCPDSQKQALLTVVSICQQNGQNVEFLKEIGGVSFIYDLSRASLYPEVKETALFTLASLAEYNENCKQTLCRKEIFCGLAEYMKRETSLRQKRVAVYMISVLVSNNKQGQSLAKDSGCIGILLNLFSESFPAPGTANELLQLWITVSSALCGSVNNPQNEENQCACMCSYPIIKMWLLQVSVSQAELVQPVCSFISMTVANNSCAQEYFASVGGLVTLSNTFTSVVNLCKDDSVACKLAAMITKTLSACISDNEVLAPVLAELSLVPQLLQLLSSPYLSARDQLAVVLTLGHCTDACVEQQSQLLQAGGLPLMISLLTEANDQEVRKAATFVLQACKNIMEPASDQYVEFDLQRHRQSAQELLQRIQHLEDAQLVSQMGMKQLNVETSTDQSTQPLLTRSPWDEECSQECLTDTLFQKVKGQRLVHEKKHRMNILEQNTTHKIHPVQPVTAPELQKYDSVLRVRRQIVRDFDKLPNSSQPRKTESRQMENTEMEIELREKKKEIKIRESDRTERNEKGAGEGANRNPDRGSYNKPPVGGDRDTLSPEIFKLPALKKRHQQRPPFSEDEMSLCSELLDSEIERTLFTPGVSPKVRRSRCAGCESRLSNVNSRTFGLRLRSCNSLCDFHLVLHRAENRYRRFLQRERTKHMHAHDNRRGDNADKSNYWNNMRLISLTPLKRPKEEEGKW